MNYIYIYIYMIRLKSVYESVESNSSEGRQKKWVHNLSYITLWKETKKIQFVVRVRCIFILLDLKYHLQTKTSRHDALSIRLLFRLLENMNLLREVMIHIVSKWVLSQFHFLRRIVLLSHALHDLTNVLAQFVWFLKSNQIS